MSAAERSAKICLLGDAAVGKTSLVRRYVHQTFSDSYLTTIGARVDTRAVALPDGGRIKLVIWDLADTQVLAPPYVSYVRGASGCLLVADGTRAYTLDTALSLQADLARLSGKDLPCFGLLNKADLAEKWELDEAALHQRGAAGWLKTSARTGANVEDAFQQLALAITHRAQSSGGSSTPLPK